MNFARKKYDEHLQWLREFANEKKLRFSDVLRADIKAPIGQNRLADLAFPELAEHRLIELGRVEYYEQIFNDLMKLTNSDVERLAENRLQEMRSQAASHAADIRHSKPGASREKQKNIRNIWASGKYTSREICAEEEYVALGFGSHKTARNALTKTPDPEPWPAKKTKDK